MSYTKQEQKDWEDFEQICLIGGVSEKSFHGWEKKITDDTFKKFKKFKKWKRQQIKNNKKIIPCDRWEEGKYGDCKNCGFPKYRHLHIGELYNEMNEILYHKQLGKLATRVDWSIAYESGVCDNGPGGRLQILKQNAWVEKSFEEWENKYLSKIDMDKIIFNVFEDVEQDVVTRETSEVCTCIICGKSILPYTMHHVTGLFLDDHGMIASCDSRHIECESTS